MVEEPTWCHTIEANLSDVQTRVYDSVGEEPAVRTLEIRSMCLDTGATEILMHDDQDVYLRDKRPAMASVVGAKVDSVFDATSRGTMAMACLNQPVLHLILLDHIQFLPQKPHSLLHLQCTQQSMHAGQLALPCQL